MDDFDDRFTGAPGEPSGTAHLCPECRDLMYDVLAAHRRVLDTPARVEPPAWLGAMNWLDAHCGSRQAVLTLGTAVLAGPLPDPPRGLDPAVLGRLPAVAELLEAAAQRFFDGADGEVHLALRRALVLVAEQRPALLAAERPVRLALGIVWAVAKANGLLHPTTALTERTVREFLGSDAPASSVGRKVQTALRSVYSWADEDRPSWRWPATERTADALAPLGQPGLLTAHTRRRLLVVRERALQAAVTEPWPLPDSATAAA